MRLKALRINSVIKRIHPDKARINFWILFNNFFRFSKRFILVIVDNAGCGICYSTRVVVTLATAFCCFPTTPHPTLTWQIILTTIHEGKTISHWLEAATVDYDQKLQHLWNHRVVTGSRHYHILLWPEVKDHEITNLITVFIAFSCDNMEHVLLAN